MDSAMIKTFFAEWHTVIGPLLSLVIGVLTLIVLYLQIRTTKELKRADILQGFNARYDRLWDIQHNPSTVEEPQTFYTRFWSLQLDQFVQWRDGYINQKDYRVWLLQRRGDFQAKSAFKGVASSDGWEAAKKEIAASPAFVALIERLRDPMADLEAAMKNAKRE